MSRIRGFVGIIVAAALLSAATTRAQDVAAADVWRAFAQKLEAGQDVNVRLVNGQRFRATIVDARSDVLLLQPKTRVTVPIQQIQYDSIALLERRSQGGMGAAKAIGIGAATGAATFFGILLILLSGLD